MFNSINSFAGDYHLANTPFNTSSDTHHSYRIVHNIFNYFLSQKIRALSNPLSRTITISHILSTYSYSLGEKLDLTDSFALMTMITALNFFIFILTSSYLANLATVLFEGSIPPPPLVVSADSANANYQSLCALASPTSTINPYSSNPNANFVNGKFPLISVVQKPYPGNPTHSQTAALTLILPY